MGDRANDVAETSLLPLIVRQHFAHGLTFFFRELPCQRDLQLEERVGPLLCEAVHRFRVERDRGLALFARQVGQPFDEDRGGHG